MVYLRYLTCLVAAVAVIRYTVYLEIYTPIVYEVKTFLGLDTSQIDQARQNLKEPGLVAKLGSYFGPDNAIPSLSEVIAGDAEKRRDKQLPEPLNGWMRQVAEVDLGDIETFEAQFLTSQERPLEKEIAAAIAGGMNVEGAEELSFSDLLTLAGMSMSGAYYYRENMELMVTISSMPKAMEWISEQVLAAPTFSHSDGGEVRFNGATLPVKRHKSSGYGLVQTRIGDNVTVQLRGDVPNDVFEAYLKAFDWDKLASL